jgi:hypothetical protein
MKALEALVSAPPVLAALSLIAVGFVVAFLRFPKQAQSRKIIVGLLWATCFVVIGEWIMQQQSLVLAGSKVQTQDQPVAVAIKGVTRYVTEQLAYRHEFGMLVLLAAIIAFAAIYSLAVSTKEA